MGAGLEEERRGERMGAGVAVALLFSQSLVKANDWLMTAAASRIPPRADP